MKALHSAGTTHVGSAGPSTIPFPAVSVDVGDSLMPAWSRGALATTALFATVWVAVGLLPLHTGSTWAHLAAGHAITADGVEAAMTATDGRSVYQPWASQTLLHGLYQQLGPEGLVLTRSVLVLLSAAIWFVSLGKMGIQQVASTLVVALAAALVSPILLEITPSLFGLLSMSVLFAALRIGKASIGQAALVALLFAVWANWDSSFVLGLAVMAVHAATAGRQRAIALVALAAAGLACCLHPLGLWTIPAAVQSAFAGGLSPEGMAGPLVVTSPRGLLFFASITIVGLCLRHSRRLFSAADGCLLLFFAALALFNSAALIWWAPAFVFGIGPHLGSMVQSILDIEKPSRLRTSFNTAAAMLAIFAALVWSPSSQAWIVGQPRSEAVLLADDAAYHLAREIEKRQLTGRVFCPADWSAYLSWHGAARIEPLVSPADEAARPAVWKDYQAIATASATWFETLRFQGVEILVLRPADHRSLAKLVRDHEQCRVLYEDQSGMIVQVRKTDSP